MIFEAILNMVSALLQLVFGWINLPDLPASITSLIDEFFGYIEGGMGIIGIFLDLDVVRVLLPILIVVINFEEVWKFVMFIVRKIPFLGIH